MSAIRLALLTLVTMLCFAGNSVLCRLALRQTSIDAASFTTVRLVSGALMLVLLVYGRHHFRGVVSVASGRMNGLDGNWLSALALGSALLMLASGVAWGVYSLRGRGVADPTGETAGNFLRAALMSALLSGVLLAQQQLDTLGLLYAMLSGAVTSGLGYAIWYAVVPRLTRTRAATVQLSVPVLAALAGVLFVQEPITLRLLLTSTAVLGGIALVVLNKHAAV